MRRQRSGRGGFTLGEIMIVVSIMCMLLAVMLPSLARARSQSHLAACVQNLRAMGGAYQMYVADHPGMKDMPPSFYTPLDTGPWSYLVPKYLGKIPICPSTGRGAIQYPMGYVWIDYWPAAVDDPVRYPYVMCYGGHNDVLPPGCAARGVGPVWSARSGIDDCHTGAPVY